MSLRADKVFAQVSAASGLTRDGAEWLKQALDPFHDTMTRPIGYPDTTASASVVQCIKQSYPITCPTGVPGNWDCNIVMMPWLSATTALASTTNGAGGVGNGLAQINAAAGGPLCGGVQVIAAASGTSLAISTPNSTTYTNQPQTIPTTYLQGNSRCVGMAMEICNTTSDLNRQGLATVYRIPVPQNDDGSTVDIKSFITADTTSFTGAASIIYMPQPPVNIAAAQLFAGTKAWAAEKGSYNVATLNTPDVPALGVSFTQPVMYATAASDATVFMQTISRNNSNAVANVGLAQVPGVYWTEFDMSGTFFTGLSNSTTLTVNYIVYIERFPTQDDLDLIVSAKASPQYDIRALELYSEVAQNVPVAVCFDENDSGGWWDGIVGAVKSVVGMSSGVAKLAAPILSSIPHPAVQGFGHAAQAIGSFGDYFDQPASDTKVAPRAPPINLMDYRIKPRRGGGNISAAQLSRGRKGLKKTKTIRRDTNKLMRDIRSVKGKPKGKGGSRRRQFTI